MNRTDEMPAAEETMTMMGVMIDELDKRVDWATLPSVEGVGAIRVVGREGSGIAGRCHEGKKRESKFSVLGRDRYCDQGLTGKLELNWVLDRIQTYINLAM